MPNGVGHTISPEPMHRSKVKSRISVHCSAVRVRVTEWPPIGK